MDVPTMAPYLRKCADTIASGHKRAWWRTEGLLVFIAADDEVTIAEAERALGAAGLLCEEVIELGSKTVASPIVALLNLIAFLRTLSGGG